MATDLSGDRVRHSGCYKFFSWECLNAERIQVCAADAENLRNRNDDERCCVDQNKRKKLHFAAAEDGA